jgi:vesicular inhibitory amino acid transporter
VVQLLNTLGDIIGTGLLACPIAFAHAGWILGPILLILIGALTLYTYVLSQQDAPDPFC